MLVTVFSFTEHNFATFTDKSKDYKAWNKLFTRGLYSKKT